MRWWTPSSRPSRPSSTRRRTSLSTPPSRRTCASRQRTCGPHSRSWPRWSRAASSRWWAPSTSACTAAAFSPSTAALVVARALMGVGAAGAIGPALAILAVLFSPDERGPAVAAWAMFGAAGLAVGPIAGGLLLDHFWWGSVFLVNVPLVVVGVVAGIAVIPESTKPNAGKLDVVGAVLSVAALGSLLAGLIE